MNIFVCFIFHARTRGRNSSSSRSINKYYYENSSVGKRRRSSSKNNIKSNNNNNPLEGLGKLWGVHERAHDPEVARRVRPCLDLLLHCRLAVL